MIIEATFVVSAAAARDFPHDALRHIALVGRSNVGKSSLINALVRQPLARTSAAPGKTRLANIYCVARGAGPAFYLVDLPGYGFARGGSSGFTKLAREYFGSARGRAEAEALESRREASASVRAGGGAPAAVREVSALLLIDARHPGLGSDREAWNWLKHSVEHSAIVAAKIDKLARGERIRALRELESVFEDSVLPFSAVTGEGLDQLWKLIDKLASNRNPQQPPSSSPDRGSRRRKATAPPRRWSASISPRSRT